MRIAVMGTGGVGGYFGARLAAAGGDVAFIARGAHKEAIARDGLRVLSPTGDLHVRPAQVVDDPRAVGPCDVVLFAVKLWDTERAAELVRPLLGADTAGVSLQNGVEQEDTIARVLGPGHVMGGVARISAAIESPGVIRHAGIPPQIVFGERDGRDSPRQRALLAACRAAGVDARASDHIDRDIWEKFVFLVPMSG
ncbi:MAG TPA: 2-dehydropantoate 2-reductase, partial [Geminicoccaceae bacterium]|nr:2-dehydropantoate 2-reductase [Geminicoccaceae bacterium]